MRNTHCKTWNMAKNTEKHVKCEMHTVGHGIWQETMKKMENEKCILQGLENREKIEKLGK